jgi:hypothetical protein
MGRSHGRKSVELQNVEDDIRLSPLHAGPLRLIFLEFVQLLPVPETADTDEVHFPRNVADGVDLREPGKFSADVRLELPDQAVELAARRTITRKYSLRGRCNRSWSYPQTSLNYFFPNKLRPRFIIPIFESQEIDTPERHDLLYLSLRKDG